MHRSFIRTLLLTCCVVCGCTEQNVSDRSVARVSNALERALSDQERVDVLVSFREPPHAGLQSPSEQAQVIAQLQRDVLARSGQGFQVSRTFRHVPALAGAITQSALETLRRDPSVNEIQLDAPGRGALAQAVPAIGADTVQGVFKVTGRGVRVAVLDTGVDAEHPDLRGAVVAQHCFTSGGCPPFGSNEGTSAQDDNGHGTAVAGVIASRGLVAPRGFAPDAEIVAVKVQGADNRGVSNSWVAALDWLYANRIQLSVDVVVMSFGTERLFNSQDCDQMLGTLSRAVDNLVRAGVPVIASSGNAGSDTLLPAPACTRGVIAVGASYDSAVGMQPPGGGTYATQLGAAFAACRDDNTSATTMACFTNTGPKLDLLAPGAPILSSALEGRASETWGTSNGAAAVGGVVALLRQCNADLGPMELKELLVRTATQSTASAARPSYPILNARKAVEEACPDVVGPQAGAGGAGGAAAHGGAAGAAGKPGPLSAAAGADSGRAAQAGASGEGAAGDQAATTAANASQPGSPVTAAAVPLADADQEDAGGLRSFPLMPIVPVRGSLPPQPPAQAHGCSIGIRGAHPRSNGLWSLALTACALGWCAHRRRSGRRQP